MPLPVWRSRLPDPPPRPKDATIRGRDRSGAWPPPHRPGILLRMARGTEHASPTHSPTLRRLATSRDVKLPSRRLTDVLADRGPLRGAVTDAGTRALQEQRGERA